MAVVGLHHHKTTKGFLATKQPTQLPLVKSYYSKHEKPPIAAALPKRPAATLLQSLKPFFRHTVSVQLLNDTADEPCFHLVRDYNGELIDINDSRRLYRRFEHTIAQNRINLTRRGFPYINNCLSTDRQTDSYRGVTRGVNPFIPSRYGNAYIVNNGVCDHRKQEETQQLLNSLSEKQKGKKSNIKTVDFDYPSLSDLSDLSIIDERLPISSPDGRRVTGCLSRDCNTLSKQSRANAVASVSPECMSPQIIKIIPQIKEPAVRPHVTKKECKRRNKSHVACAPPPSPALSKYNRVSSQNGIYLRPKSVLLL